MAALELSWLFQAPLDESHCRWLDVADVALRDETPQNELNLRALVWIVAKLSMVEQWVEHSEIGVSQLTSVEFDVKTNRFSLFRQIHEFTNEHI